MEGCFGNAGERLQLDAADAIIVRAATGHDHASILGLLAVLPTLYPKGDAWLERTVAQWAAGRASILVAEHRRSVVGVTIVKPKRRRERKLCTIYVDPGARRRGIGQALIASVRDDWRLAGVDRAVVTCRVGAARELEPVLSRFGFRPIALESNRYGLGEHELVFRWDAGTQPDGSPVFDRGPIGLVRTDPARCSAVPQPHWAVPGYASRRLSREPSANPDPRVDGGRIYAEVQS